MIRNLKKKKKKGFTLIELIIVIAILAILAAIAVPQFSKIRQNANVSTDISNAKTIHSTVATAIANEELLLPTGTAATATKKYYELEQVGEGTVAAGTAINVSSEIDGRVVPKAEQKSRFIIMVDQNGSIEVHVLATTTTSATAGTIVYPNPATNTIYYK